MQVGDVMEFWVNDSEDLLEIGALGIDDILQCVKVLLTTIKGTVWMDRELGIDIRLIDTPLNRLPLTNKEIYDLIEFNEPRVTVKDIKHTTDNLNYKATTSVLIEIKPEYLLQRQVFVSE